jgi:hypothetical protein
VLDVKSFPLIVFVFKIFHPSFGRPWRIKVQNPKRTLIKTNTKRTQFSTT